MTCQSWITFFWYTLYRNFSECILNMSIIKCFVLLHLRTLQFHCFWQTKMSLLKRWVCLTSLLSLGAPSSSIFSLFSKFNILIFFSNEFSSGDRFGKNSCICDSDHWNTHQATQVCLSKFYFTFILRELN